MVESVEQLLGLGLDPFAFGTTLYAMGVAATAKQVDPQRPWVIWR